MPTHRTVLVTGASGAIGAAVCKALLAQNHDVIAVTRNPNRLKFACEKLQQLTLDLADLDALPNALRAFAERTPQLDAAILCAGRGNFGSLEEFSYASIRSLIDLNLTSQAYVARAIVPLFKRNGRGDLLFIGSEAGLHPGRRGAIYSASKAAVRALAGALRDECARRGVRVTVINPGMVRSAFFDGLAFEPGADPENYLLPEDVADAVELVLNSRAETVFDEINLSPLKKVVRFKTPPE